MLNEKTMKLFEKKVEEMILYKPSIKVVNLTHVDADGYTCAAIVHEYMDRLAIGTEVDFTVFRYNYGGDVKNIPGLMEALDQADVFFVTDLSVSSQDFADFLMEEYQKFGMMMLWFDHHQVTVDWERQSTQAMSSIHGVRWSGIAGCLLTELSLNAMSVLTKYEEECETWMDQSPTVVPKFHNIGIEVADVLNYLAATKGIASIYDAYMDGEETRCVPFIWRCSLADTRFKGTPELAIEMNRFRVASSVIEYKNFDWNAKTLYDYLFTRADDWFENNQEAELIKQVEMSIGKQMHDRTKHFAMVDITLKDGTVKEKLTVCIHESTHNFIGFGTDYFFDDLGKVDLCICKRYNTDGSLKLGVYSAKQMICHLVANALGNFKDGGGHAPAAGVVIPKTDAGSVERIEELPNIEFVLGEDTIVSGIRSFDVFNELKEVFANIEGLPKTEFVLGEDTVVNGIHSSEVFSKIEEALKND